MSNSQLGLAPKYLSDLMSKSLSATSLHFLRCRDRMDIFVLRITTTLAQHRAFAVVGPSARDDLPPVLRTTLIVWGILLIFSFPEGVSISPRASALRVPLNSPYCERRFINVQI